MNHTLKGTMNDHGKYGTTRATVFFEQGEMINNLSKFTESLTLLERKSSMDVSVGLFDLQHPSAIVFWQKPAQLGDDQQSFRHKIVSMWVSGICGDDYCPTET